ncbi:MAG: ribonuclease HI [Bacteroidales bacterium]|nr:ribonuclease HI [Bacteroidales bacterium]
MHEMKILKKNTLYIYTDGSSLPKPRRGGIGIRYIYLDNFEEEHKIDLELDGFSSATNNQMELSAVIEGIKNSGLQDIPINYLSIEVRTDSRYVVDNFKNAVYNWSNQGWLNKNGRPIENAELWKKLIKEVRKIKHKVDFIWVKGHKSDIHNIAVDNLAKKSAKSFLNNPISVVKLRRKKSKKSTKRGSIDMRGQRVSIHIINEQYLNIQKLSKYRYEIISSNSKYYGNVDIIFSELHHLKAGHKYIVTFNTDSNNPRILKMIKEIK